MTSDNSNGSRFDRRRFIQLAGGSTAATLLAGCSGSQNDQTTTTTTKTDAGSSGGSGESDTVLDVVWPGGVNNINPLGWLTIPDYDAVRMMYEPLTSVDKKAKAIGHVAKDWETSDDGATYTWHLQDGITWHDGEPLTAEDVAYTFRAIKKYDWPYLGSLSSVIADPDQIEVKDDTTVVTPLTQPYAALPLVLADLGMIEPKHIWTEFDDPTGVSNTDDPVGSGPFVFERRKQDQIIEFSVDDDYWGETPDYEKVRVNIVSSTDSQVLTMKKGKGDMLRLQPGQYISQIEKADNLSVVKAGSTYVNYLGVNTNRDPLSDKALRQAMAYAFDRQAMAKFVMGGYADPGYSPIPPGLKFYHNSNTNTYEKNREKARTILENNGYKKQGKTRVDPDGNKLEFSLSIPNTGNWPRLAEITAQQLGKVGITVDVHSMESNAFDQKVTVKHDYDLSLNTWRVWFDPDPFLAPVFEETGSLNTAQYDSKKFDDLMEKQRKATDPKQRQQYLYQAQDVLTEDVPWIVLFYPNLLHGMRSSAWTNFNPIPRYGMQSPYGIEPGTGPMVQLDPK